MAETKYAKALKKLNDIVERIESDEVDVDELSDKVKEAVELIRFCKDKIEKAEMDVKKTVEDFQTKDNG